MKNFKNQTENFILLEFLFSMKNEEILHPNFKFPIIFFPNILKQIPPTPLFKQTRLKYSRSSDFHFIKNTELTNKLFKFVLCFQFKVHSSLPHFVKGLIITSPTKNPMDMASRLCDKSILNLSSSPLS